MILLNLSLFAQDNSQWILNKASLYVDNDLYYSQDNSYSAGERISLSFYIPQENYTLYQLLGNNDIQTDSYIDFSLTSQIYTPTDISKYDLIQEDRPYVGWSYIETIISKVSKDELRSLSLKLGIIGKASGAEWLQTHLHSLGNFDNVNGWDNQLENELGINLAHTQKWRYELQSYKGFQSTIIPFVSAELGNIAINATGGFTSRFGWNIPKDFGVSTINMGAQTSTSIYGYNKDYLNKNWCFSFNFSAAGSAVAKDIFTDGNTFNSSHSVEKENFVGYYAFGASLRYKNYILDFMETHNTKQFKLEKKSHTVGTIVLTYIF
ncbi:MAG: lipid A deacylase LpxR family protein [Sulfurimonas sp.]|nr:lipid A deacylase LpxR family protein [Sulfurimonas sp.]